MVIEGKVSGETEPYINPALLNELLLTGIPELPAKHALLRTGNSSSDLAISWYFENMSDPTLNQPLPKMKKIEKAMPEKPVPKYTEDSIANLIDFGFSREQAIFGLSNTVTCSLRKGDEMY